MLIYMISVMIEVFTIIILHIFCCKTLGIKTDNKKLIVFVWAIFFVLTMGISELTDIFIVNTIFFFVSKYVVIMILYKGDIKSKILLVASIYVLGMISEVLLLILFNIIFNINIYQISDNENAILINTILSKVVWFSLMKILSVIVKNKNDYGKGKTNSWLEVFMVPIMSIIVIIFILPKANEDLSAFHVMEIAMLLVINIIAFNLFEKIKEHTSTKVETKLLKEQCKEYLKQCKEIEELWVNMSSFRHDIKNRYIIEKGYLDDKNYELLFDEYNEVLKNLKLKELKGEMLYEKDK